jgi:hypothetical protein
MALRLISSPVPPKEGASSPPMGGPQLPSSQGLGRMTGVAVAVAVAAAVAVAVAVGVEVGVE